MSRTFSYKDEDKKYKEAKYRRKNKKIKENHRKNNVLEESHDRQQDKNYSTE